MNTYNNGYAVTKNGSQPKGNNSPFILIKSGNGTIRKMNPHYNKNLCAKCGKSKGIFHFLVCG